MSARTFLNGRVVLHAGDCLAVLPTLAENSIDSCVTDPPYHLTSGNAAVDWSTMGPNGSKRPNVGPTNTDGRGHKTGFMGKQWDGGDIAFRPETWAEVLRVLKPGAHLLAFGGTRTYHRLACAIEDAGFEVRDAILWHYGSGFPKSHDVSKGIDKRGPNQDYVAFPEFAKHYAERRKASEMTHAQVCALGNFFGSVNHGGTSVNWERGYALPTIEQWDIVAPALGLESQWRKRVTRKQYERELLGYRDVQRGVAFTSNGLDNLPVTAPGCEASAKWSGWGTALKPATEIIVLARKPLSERTIAANVLRWGTGALNIDGCRVAGSDIGRWPANVIHDGSPEVLEAFPENCPGMSSQNDTKTTTSNYFGADKHPGFREGRGDTGSAARFFYTAKADSFDRIGSKHPTVKPLDLIQYLCRLVTPPAGVVLDPFAGSGTTGEAAWREGFRAVLIEREAEYVADIERRMALALAGPDERARESIKACTKEKPIDAGPLFEASP